MDYPSNTISLRKQKYLNFEERMIIQLCLKDGYSPYKIAKELNHASITIRNKIKRGAVSQIKQGKTVMLYLADEGESVYINHRKDCCPKFKRFVCNEFIEYVCAQMNQFNWSVDACFGDALQTKQFKREEMVCTKTLYNYIDLGLLEISNIDLPMRLRRNTKPGRVRSNKRKLGISIEDRPDMSSLEKSLGTGK